jgi:ABC-2 type transport system permease protein
LLVLSFVANTILPLFTALVTIDCFSGEFSHNLMRVTLTRPVSRFKIFSAKISAITIFVFANLLFLFILSTLAGFLFNANSASVAYFSKTVLSYVVSLFPLVVLALGIALLTNILKNPTSVFFISILLFLAMKAFGVLFSQYSSFLITSQLDWYNLWLSYAFPLDKIIRRLLIMVGYAIMFFTAGYYLFDRKEF